LMKVNYSNAEPVDHRQIERNIGMRSRQEPRWRWRSCSLCSVRAQT
jgi:hypothetical protein